ncbi:MAG: type II toxin-antitoxin system Phd/YefM family antitoxin [Verrucomicrobiales bacterium]
MQTATVRELQNDYTSLLDWVRAGEEVIITQKGVPVAKLCPVRKIHAKVNWASSPEVTCDRKDPPILGLAESAAILAESGGRSHVSS